ncbi:accessory Sec system protein Asp2 [Aerococcus sp. UMB8608]|nr:MULTISPECIES: accessory Sec system protein Asp2 [unclassified Aerococcus]MDK6370043.1 accessory Sec system protein Asp2 [Aerococcus sp. UMB9870]MDK6680736.1 accessory Sec system protein Asp2 [Aerococcus sp. UMB8608]MDK6687557.1 accessory Sec system protein Asp2 [Aerococcus sp. UMB8623]MDK6939679.1 accessory Sec system protein Asp2 [Aerococcus sp. UMB8487]
MDWTFIEPSNPSLTLEELGLDTEPRPFSLVLITGEVPPLWATDLLPYMEAYSVFIDSRYMDYYKQTSFKAWFDYKLAKFVQIMDPAYFVVEMTKLYFDGNYGERMNITLIQFQDSFKGRCRMEGHNSYQVEAIDESEWTPFLYWQRNLVVSRDRYIDLWLEYQADDSLDIRLRVYYTRLGSINELVQVAVYTEEDLKETITLDPSEDAYATCCLEVKGKGKIRLSDLHIRHSRKEFGCFIPGGQVLRDNRREELIFYFHPGNLKPPLNVYFSGYRTAEGFEGFWMMKGLEHPFILVGDPRSEGGAFYQVSQELESRLLAKINSCLDQLGFDDSQIIFSGLSMGTTGACYYSSFFNPYAVVIGKPLLSLGNMARKQRLVRPDEFQTSLDLVRRFDHGDQEEVLEFMDQRILNRMAEGAYRGTTFAVSYMKNDDYDDTAYYRLLEVLRGKSAKVISKSFLGRHNDNTPGITNWFINQYRRLLTEAEGEEVLNASRTIN